MINATETFLSHWCTILIATGLMSNLLARGQMAEEKGASHSIRQLDAQETDCAVYKF